MDKSSSFFNRKQTITCNGEIVDLSKPMVMGIINVTPDSFYGASRYMMRYRIAQRAKQIVEQGGEIIDVGACSTRPSAQLVSEKDELKRLNKALSAIRKVLPAAIVSVDTFRASVAKHVVENFGVSIINDISAGEMDANMFPTIAKLNVPYILMHMQGTPATMQKQPQYGNVVRDVFTFLNIRVEKLKILGVNDILIDPGFGFGKTIEQNYTLLRNLGAFCLLDLPIVAGLSRKSMIYSHLNISPKQALNGTTVLNTIALNNGAKILRVHDVKEAIEAINLTQFSNSQQLVN